MRNTLVMTFSWTTHTFRHYSRTSISQEPHSSSKEEWMWTYKQIVVIITLWLNVRIEVCVERWRWLEHFFLDVHLESLCLKVMVFFLLEGTSTCQACVWVPHAQVDLSKLCPREMGAGPDGGSGVGGPDLLFFSAHTMKENGRRLDTTLQHLDWACWTAQPLMRILKDWVVLLRKSFEMGQAIKDLLLGRFWTESNKSVANSY